MIILLNGLMVVLLIVVLGTILPILLFRLINYLFFKTKYLTNLDQWFFGWLIILAICFVLFLSVCVGTQMQHDGLYIFK